MVAELITCLITFYTLILINLFFGNTFDFVHVLSNRKRQYPDDLSRSPNPKRRREASPSGGPRRRDTSPSGMLYRRANSPTALQRRRANSPTNVARRQEGSPSESQHSSQSRERMERDQRYQRTPEFGRERQVGLLIHLISKI